MALSVSMSGVCNVMVMLPNQVMFLTLGSSILETLNLLSIVGTLLICLVLYLLSLQSSYDEGKLTPTVCFFSHPASKKSSTFLLDYSDFDLLLFELSSTFSIIRLIT